MGSGLGKILDPYKALPFFTERMLPSLYSDRSQFMVTFPNMIQVWKEEHEGAEINYVVNDTYDDTSNGTHGRFRGEELDEWIAYQLAVHPKMTTEELSSLSGKGIRIIKRHIADLQRFKYIGSGANSYWLV